MKLTVALFPAFAVFCLAQETYPCQFSGTLNGIPLEFDEPIPKMTDPFAQTRLAEDLYADLRDTPNRLPTRILGENEEPNTDEFLALRANWFKSAYKTMMACDAALAHWLEYLKNDSTRCLMGKNNDELNDIATSIFTCFCHFIESAKAINLAPFAMKSIEKGAPKFEEATLNGVLDARFRRMEVSLNAILSQPPSLLTGIEADSFYARSLETIHVANKRVFDYWTEMVNGPNDESFDQILSWSCCLMKDYAMLDSAWDKGPSELFRDVENRMLGWVNHYSAHPDDLLELGAEEISYLLGYLLELEVYRGIFAQRMDIESASLRTAEYTDVLTTIKAWSDMSLEDQQRAEAVDRELFERDYRFRN